MLSGAEVVKLVANVEQDVNSSKPGTIRKKINSKIDHSFLMPMQPIPFSWTFISIGSSEEAALSVGYAAWRKVLVCNPDVHET